LKNKTDVSGW
jgi:hypothetical protein